MSRSRPGRRGARKRLASTPAPGQSATADLTQVTGRISVNRRGFAFISRDDGEADLFVPPPFVGNAMHGDRVQVSLHAGQRGPEARVAQVLERWLTQVTGTVCRQGRDFILDLDDDRIPGPMWLRGEAKALQRLLGQICVARILRYPEGRERGPEGEITATLGKAGTAEVEVAKLKVREGVVEHFPPEVQAAAEALPTRLRAQDRRGREDLRHLDFLTIDPPDARDHDDALWGEALPGGGFRLIIAIADVSHYVPEGSPMDREALARGCSIYLPTRAIPMLPGPLSSGLASLVPQRDRLCLALEVELGARGAIRRHRYIEGVIRSRARLSYGGAARALGLTERPAKEGAAERYKPLLTVLLAASHTLKKKRLRRGTLEFELPEPKLDVDPDSGQPRDILRAKSDPGVRQTYQLVEELMLLANEVVAADLKRRGAATIYRVHGRPDPQKLEQFSALAASFGYVLDPEDAENPQKLAHFSRKIAKSPQSSVLYYLLLRAMQQATYDIDGGGHFGLAAPDYLHFTSPIRRYPDLAVHRVVRQVIRGAHLDLQQARRKLKGQARESSRLERRAMVLERDVVDLYRALLMRERLGEEFAATVSGVEHFGLFCTLDAPFVDTFTPIEMLADTFHLDPLGTVAILLTNFGWG
ncbi:MAG: ribonuclease R family protein, partial [Polyangiales bacterium]